MSKNDSVLLTRDIAPFGVRMPADLKGRVEAAAKANSRSMNAEIVATLEEKYPAPSASMTNEEIESLLDAFDHSMGDDEIAQLIAEMNDEFARRPLNGRYRIQLTKYDREKLRPEFIFEVLGEENGDGAGTGAGRGNESGSGTG